MSKEGHVVDMFPPGNDGSKKGAGIVQENDGTSNGEKYVFLTPKEVSGAPISEQMKVCYDRKGDDISNLKPKRVEELVK